MAPVLVFNAGSSSVKYQLIDVERDEPLAKGVVERVGAGGHGTHAEAVSSILAELGSAVPDHLDEVVAVGHRIVHGGSRFVAPTVIDEATLDELDELGRLAPLHNPPAIAAVRAAMEAFGALPQVAVFDTAFFADIPAAAATYALPADLAAQHGIRRYGFHGISHEYVAHRAAAVLDRPLDDLRQIVFHLGNGASATAIDRGRAVDTSMGMTPLEGLVMGTRAGDLDPGIVVFLQREAGLGADEIDELLNRRSGLIGMAGINDFRDLQTAADGGDAAASLAIDVVVHRLRKYLGAYLVTLGGVDCIVFTAGIGEHSSVVRQRVCAGLESFGIVVAAPANAADEAVISTPQSPVAVLVVPTDEERAIAQAVSALVSS